LLNFPNTPSVVQLLGLAQSPAATESQLLQPDDASTLAGSSSDTVKQEPPLQITTAPELHDSSIVDSTSDIANAPSIFQDDAQSTRHVIAQETGGGGDATNSLVGKASDIGEACCGSLLYQPSGLQHAGAGDDVGVSPAALLSNQTEAQLQEFLRQQQWHLRLNQMMQLDVMQQQQTQEPMLLGGDTSASLLWHQHQQQHVTNPATVSFAFCSEQAGQQQPQPQQAQPLQQQLLLQQQQTSPIPTSVELKYEAQQQPVQAKPAAEGQQTQSPRQQKPRLIARGNNNNNVLLLSIINPIYVAPFAEL